MTAETRDRPRYGVVGLVVAVLFGLVYAWDVWEAVGNVLELPGAIAQFNEIRAVAELDPIATPWALLIAGVLTPVAVYAAAFWLGRTHSLVAKVLLFVGGLAVVGAASLSINALAASSLPF